MCHLYPYNNVKLLRKFFFYFNIDIGKYLRAFQNFYAKGPPNVNLGPPNIPKSTRARILKLKKTIKHCEILALGEKMSPLGAYRGRKAL